MTTAQLSPTGGRDVHTVRFPAAAPPSDAEVLVVGAGPNGLGTAIELTARGVRAAVVDRATEATLVRAGAMGHSPRTVEHFRRWGLLQDIRDEWTFPPEWNQGIRFVTSLAGHDLAPNPRPAFAATAGTARPQAAEAASRGLPLTVVHLSEPSLRAAYGDGTVLVRPDQHVAWRGTSLPEGGAAAVLDHVLGIRQAPAAGAPEPGTVLAGTVAG